MKISVSQLVKDKTVLPVNCLEFLGITIDTVRMEFRLPLAKLKTIAELLIVLLRKKKVLLRERQKLLGLLAFATRILPVGRIFSRWLYFAISGLKKSLFSYSLNH